jgi:hypothetical protein
MADNNSEADRVVERNDNNPPEMLPMLPSAKELPAVVRKDLTELSNNAVLSLDTYSRVPDVITSDDIYQRITTLAGQIKDIVDDVTKRKGVHKRPYLDANKYIDDAFKLALEKDGDTRLLSKELDAAMARLKGLLSAYDTRKYLEAQAAAEAEAKALADAAAQDGIQMDPSVVEATLSSTVQSAHGGKSVRSIKTEWSVVDESLLPRSVLSIDPAKVEKMIADGATSIPGIALNKKVDTYVKRR